MLQTRKHFQELTSFTLPFQQNQKAIFKAAFILTTSQVQICSTTATVLDDRLGKHQSPSSSL